MAAAFGHGPGRHVLDLVAGLRFAMGEGDERPALYDAGKRCLLRLRAEFGNQRSGKQGRAEVQLIYK